MENDQKTSGIKLFGKTIAIQIRQVKEEHHQEKSSPDENRQPIGAHKRPDKIIPCPRCKSMETKFCYFNNYNVNQPRHFCKGCQRYWTAGGALRNVPVGAGRRKAKLHGHGFTGLSENCLYDASGMQQYDLVGMVEEWNMVAEHGGFQQIFPAKRRRSSSNGESC
ncbi:hypothetical protein Leryth_022295 [Lithospermum erythrorhizon]|nr:hypothetical protein Leryth_022295 [Lithospermum erythrorhizon]